MVTIVMNWMIRSRYVLYVSYQCYGGFLIKLVFRQVLDIPGKEPSKDS